MYNIYFLIRNDWLKLEMAGAFDYSAHVCTVHVCAQCICMHIVHLFTGREISNLLSVTLIMASNLGRL